MATILVADDSLVVQRTVGFILEKGDHKVLLASDGVVALELLKNSSPDLLIADINMPRMGGVELLKHVRTDEIYHDLPVIILTSLGKTVEELEIMSEGANQILTKPTSSWQLTEAVNQLLAGAQS